MQHETKTKIMTISIDSQKRVRILEACGETYYRFPLTAGVKERVDHYILMPNPYCGKSIYTEERLKLSK